MPVQLYLIEFELGESDNMNAYTLFKDVGNDGE